MNWGSGRSCRSRRRPAFASIADYLEGAFPAALGQSPLSNFLIDALRRLPTPTDKRAPLRIQDGYDVQDAVEFVLRGLYNDVRPEERTPSTAGSSNNIDFLLRYNAVASR